MTELDVRHPDAAFLLERFVQAVDDLHGAGLNWLAYARATEGPADAAVRPHQGVMLLLGLGGAFGQSTRYESSESDAFDERARKLVLPFISDHLEPHDPHTRLVYPSAAVHIHLMAWLSVARAQFPSRLGIGIRPDCGTWFAVRAAVVTDLPTAAETWLRSRYPAVDLTADSPCTQCQHTPCVQACPATAIGASFDLESCVGHRLVPDSSCATRCHARLACPVGAEFRYPEPQIAYHYGVSLTMLRRWDRERLTRR